MTARPVEDNREQEYGVTPLELFFDLVFAFAVSQLSHHLFTHLSLRGGAETVVLLLAVLTVWSYTSWAATMIPADRSSTRWMVLTVMLFGLFMNASVTMAFTTSGWAFVAPLLIIQLGRTIWTIFHSNHAVYREHYIRVLLWFAATTPLWIVGAVMNADARVFWWALAAGIELAGTWLAHPVPGRRLRSENVEFDASHMLERCRLFLLIALGESVLMTGSAIASASLSRMTLVAGTLALMGTVSLWALSFGRVHRIIHRHMEKTTNPILVSRYAVNALMVMVAGLIAIAVANKGVIGHPVGQTSPALSLLLAGGPILFLAAQGWYLWAVPKVRSKLHMAGGAALLLAGLATLAMPAYGALLLVGVCLAILAVADHKSF